MPMHLPFVQMWVLQGRSCAYLTDNQLLSFLWGTFPSMQKEVGVALTAWHAKHRADGVSSRIPRQTPLGPCPSHAHPHSFCTYMCGGMSSLNKNPISISLTCLQMLKYHYPKHNIMPLVFLFQSRIQVASWLVYNTSAAKSWNADILNNSN